MTEAELAQSIGAPNGSKSQFEMLLGVKEHEMHHRAQLFLIERMVGIVPHLTRARQERMAQQQLRPPGMRCEQRRRAPLHGAPSWWAKGLIFENCMCTLVCPGHMHFSQLCTHDRCKGYWALRFDDGAFGAVSLRGLRAFIVFDSPQRMIDGHWTQRLIVDPGADPTSAPRSRPSCSAAPAVRGRSCTASSPPTCPTEYAPSR